MSDQVSPPARGAGAGVDMPWWRAPEAVIPFVALLLSVFGFASTLGGHFQGDDFGYVGRFHDFPWWKWPKLFFQSWAGDMWGFELRELRPVAALSFIVDTRLWEGNAFGYRLTNLLLHSACAAMVGLLAWRAAERDFGCGLAAAALFALHPVHAEPVQWITGRVDTLATTLYLAGFCAFLRFRAQGGRGWAIAIPVLYAGAAFAKEFGLTLPLMFMAADLVWPPEGRRWRERKIWLPYAACVLVAAGYFFCRRAAFGPGGVGAGLPVFMSVEFQTQLAQRQLTYLYYLFPQLERWLHDGAPLIKDHGLRTFWTLVACGAIALAVWRWGFRWRPRMERRAGLFFAACWYVVATLPLIVTYISPRHLYLASAGLCVALALFLRGLLYSRIAFAAVVLAVAVSYNRKLETTMSPWADAARISGEFCRELNRLEPEIQPGSALLLDVPETTRATYVWTWATPFALRPPFTRRRLDDGIVVMESRGNYFDWNTWHEQPAVSALSRVAVKSWLLQIGEEKPVRRIPLDPEKLRPAAEEFAKGPLKEQPHETWRKMINRLAPP